MLATSVVIVLFQLVGFGLNRPPADIMLPRDVLASQARIGSTVTPIWTKADDRGQACASCHSPDGIELSAYDLTAQDFNRRVGRHFPISVAGQVTKYLLERRQVLGLKELSMANDRPMQMGNAVIPGDSPEARDKGFLDELANQFPNLFVPVTNPREALIFSQTLTQIDLHDLRAGIPMNRLSEDQFHGPNHSSIDDWLPDVPIPLTPPFLAAQRAYLASPTVASLRKLDQAAVAAMPQTSAFQQFALNKYRSLLVFQHLLRERAGMAPKETVPVLQGNPFWQIGDFGRIYALGDPQMIGIPATVLKEKQAGPSLSKQLEGLQLPWFWLGWTFDPTLIHSGFNRETMRGDYLVKKLFQDGPYPAHALFVMARKNLQTAEELPNQFELGFSFLLLGDPLAAKEPAGAEEKAKFQGFAVNAFTSSVLALHQLIDRQSSAGVLVPERLQLKLILNYANSLMASPATAFLHKTAEEAISAIDRRLNQIHAKV